jgi:hypothetical protein
MTERYLDLQTGIVLSIKEILETENHRDELWGAADELRSLLASIAEVKKEEAQGLLMEVAVIKEALRKYDMAEEILDANATGFIKEVL